MKTDLAVEGVRACVGVGSRVTLLVKATHAADLRPMQGCLSLDERLSRREAPSMVGHLFEGHSRAMRQLKR
jgi:hypothetical protein